MSYHKVGRFLRHSVASQKRCLSLRMCTGGISHVQPPTISTSLTTQKVLIGEAIMLKCLIHLRVDSGVELTWTTATDTQVQMTLCCELVHK